MRPKADLTPESTSGFYLHVRGFLKLWPYLWPQHLWGAKTRLVIAFLMMIAGKVAIMSIPILFKNLIDGLDHNVYTSLPLILILTYAGARLLSGIFSDLRDAIFAIIAERAIREAALRVFQHMHHLSLKFHLERKTGALSQLISKGIKSIEEFMQFSTFMLLPTMIEVIFVVGVFFYFYGGATALTCLTALVLYMIATIQITEWRISYIKTMNTTDAEASHRAVDSLLNFETVKYFNNEDLEIERYDQVLKVYEKAAVKSKISLGVLNSVQNLITSGALFLIMIFTVMSYHRGEISLGGVIAVNAYLLQLYQPLFTVGFAYRQVRLSLLNMDMMFNVLDEELDVQDAPDAESLEDKEQDITFENVEFSYNPQRQILKSISFHVPASHTLAIVGLSGSGKSTISKLLYRFYDITGGSINIGGKDIRNLTQKSLRRMMGVVPQDTVLFNDTIAYNILYGNPTATFEQVVESSKRAQIHEFISKLPEGYNTIVGERGLKLSGGEKQRVAIARTLLKNPKIFIFDEATSSLDSHTEREIQSQLEDLSKRHTTIMIAHRLSTITHADQIVVLDQGEIVERGTHKELLKSKGHYASLWEKQSKEETPS